MYEDIEFRHLKSFLAVAEECHFGRAAERIHITQPSLSHQIKQLEAALRTTLYTCGRHGAALTAPGRELLPFARRILDLRIEAARATSSTRAKAELPLRFGYSPFVNHDLVDEAFRGYGEIVPQGTLAPDSECSAKLVRMVREGRLDAALVSLPVRRQGLLVQSICQEDVLVCLRRDDPLAATETIPKELIGDRLRVMFDRAHHPLFYDKLLRKFDKAGIGLRPSECVSAPSEMQYLVMKGCGLGLVRESTPLLAGLTTRRIAGFDMKITTAFVCVKEQARAALPLLGFRMARSATAGRAWTAEKSHRRVSLKSFPWSKKRQRPRKHLQSYPYFLSIVP